MSATLIRTCPLCGLRFDNLPILELHIREDHRRRGRRAAQGDGDATRTPQTGRTPGPEAADRARVCAAR
ncbi:MAG TPA: hypothetical protein VEH31_15970 [Streptosporangiaceae bacterium]|nr:hypothetical protein [Streptosporangiaceae bacterium]